MSNTAPTKQPPARPNWNYHAYFQQQQQFIQERKTCTRAKRKTLTKAG